MRRPFAFREAARCGLVAWPLQSTARPIVITSIVRTMATRGGEKTRRFAMRNAAGLSMLMGALLAAFPHPSNAAPLNTMAEVGSALHACWTPPANSDNSSVTLSFSFRRDGTLIGPPRPTAVKVNGDAKARQAYRGRDRRAAALPAAELLACVRAGHRRQGLHAAVQFAEAISESPQEMRAIFKSTVQPSPAAFAAQWRARLACFPSSGVSKT